MTQSTTSLFGSNWVLSTDQNSLYRAQKATRGTTGGSGLAPTLCVNVNGEASDWAIALALVWNYTLSTAEFTLAENYVATTFNLGF